MTEIPLSVGAATHPGRVRKLNEDSHGVFLAGGAEREASPVEALLLVADGMGGERAGDRASRLAVTRLEEYVTTGRYRRWAELDETGADGDLPSVLRAAIRRLSREIYRLGSDDPTAQGLGTTLVAAAFVDGRVTVAHVGDSRCYRIREGSIERLTRDHSWVERQVERGLLAPEEAARHPQRHVLTRSLGDPETPEPELLTETVRPGDLLLLCSDGLTEGLEDSDILALARRQGDPQALAEELVRQAVERDGTDNVTVVAARYRQGDEARPALGAAAEPATRPDLPVVADPPPGSRRGWLGALVLIAVLVAGFGLGWYAASASAPPPAPARGVEAEAGRLLEQGRLHLERGDRLTALEELRRARDLFREAPLAVEAQRLTSLLERQLATGRPAEEAVPPEDGAEDQGPVEGGEPAREEEPGSSGAGATAPGL